MRLYRINTKGETVDICEMEDMFKADGHFKAPAIKQFEQAVHCGHDVIFHLNNTKLPITKRRYYAN